MVSLPVIQAAALKWRAASRTPGMQVSVAEAFRAGATYIGGRSEQEINVALGVLKVRRGARPLDLFEAGAIWAQSVC